MMRQANEGFVVLKPVLVTEDRSCDLILYLSGRGIVKVTVTLEGDGVKSPVLNESRRYHYKDGPSEWSTEAKT